MDWSNFIAEMWTSHRGRLLGVLLGLVFGILVVTVGFWKALFVSLCIVAGYTLGKRVDEEGNLRGWMERIFGDK
ncbi:MAG: DUF2273 domain-containing protein [Bacillota bacterium]